MTAENGSALPISHRSSTAPRAKSNGAGEFEHRVQVYEADAHLLDSVSHFIHAALLEDLWNELGKRSAFSLLCAYPLKGFSRREDGRSLRAICDEHSHVLPGESYTALPNAGDRFRIIVELQQKAKALGAEITVRKELETALALRVSQLAEADRRKDEFLATLAHELRNPLAPIKMAATLARSTCSCSDAARHLEMIERQADNLARLVDDLVDVSRITHGKLELRRERLEVASVAARAVESTRMLADRRRHLVEVTIADPRVEVFADPVRLEQILVNLLTNAAKYTPAEGRIHLAVERAGDRVEVRVRDTGIGLSAEDLRRVFEPFRQADRGSDRSHGGLGIGLTIARGLAEMHGGSLEARSDGIGRGAEFVLRLSVVTEGAAPRRDGEPAGLPREHGGLRVLVVDDNADAGESLADVLRGRGHRVHTASGGHAAFEIADELRPELVLLDLGLPEMSGYEVAARLRAAHPEIVLVAVTGYGQPRDHQRTAEAGFSGHLVKPVRIDALTRTLGALFAPRDAT